MNYYLIGSNPEGLEDLQNRTKVLSVGLTINTRGKLSEVLDQSLEDSSLFIVDFRKDQKKMNDWILQIKSLWHRSKIIIVTEEVDPHALRQHQEGASGGDAYLYANAEEKVFESVLNEFSQREENLGQVMNKLEASQLKVREQEFEDISVLESLSGHPLSKMMDEIFIHTFNIQPQNKTNLKKSESNNLPNTDQSPGVNMSDKDQELSLDELGELEIGDLGETPPSSQSDEGLDLNLDNVDDNSANAEAEILDLEASDDSSAEIDSSLDITLDNESDELSELSLDDLDSESEESDDEESLSLESETDEKEDEESDSLEGAGLGSEELPGLPEGDGGLSLLEDDLIDDGLSLNSELDNQGHEEIGLEFSIDESAEPVSLVDGGDLSEEARKKMMEIDALMDLDASQINLTSPSPDDLNLDFASEEINNEEASDGTAMVASIEEGLSIDALSFSGESEAPLKEQKKQEILREEKTEVLQTNKQPISADRSRNQEPAGAGNFRDISGAYAGELERTQATISNLRADREELLLKIGQLEDEKMMSNRNVLTMRAELDEKKIELSIIRKKLNEEINNLKDQNKIQEERRYILEEKNKYLAHELETAGQKNKIDTKRIQMREKELEQKLELLKTDAEIQIKNRDIKIIELKRKIDSMEFDMESISQQEKRSVESKFELEDKLDKAIKTLRTAITMLEDDSVRSNAIDVLKKNIDV